MGKNYSLLSHLDFRKPFNNFLKYFGIIISILTIIGFFFQSDISSIFNESLQINKRTFYLLIIILIFLFIYSSLFIYLNLNNFYKNFKETKQLKIDNKCRIEKIKKLEREIEDLRNVNVIEIKKTLMQFTSQYLEIINRNIDVNSFLVEIK